jgi:4a-hydroxytetrahydrobiopterin dehydratase
MARPAKLAGVEVSRRLSTLPGWAAKGDRLHKTFTFGDFAQAFAFMTDVAREAEALDHHPEWFNVYNRVAIDLTTHDASGITALDFELARRAEDLAGRRTRPAP